MVDLPTPAFWQAWVAKAALSPTAKRTDHGGDQWSAVRTKQTVAAATNNVPIARKAPATLMMNHDTTDVL